MKGWGALAIVLLPCAAYAQSPTSPCPAPRPGTVHVRGEVARPFDLDSTNWSQFPQTSVAEQGHGTPTGTYAGIPLSALLARAGVPQRNELRGKAIAQVMMVEASDGYGASYGVAELDTAFVDRAVLLANRMDGKPLTAEYGPYQVIVQHEKGTHAGSGW
jgi:DMSO/TMAO reductase YedYZ molybdopterin-dependent catalytic subunit